MVDTRTIETLLDLVGIDIPANMQGESMKPILQSPAAAGRQFWLYEHFPVFPIPIPGITGVRTDQYKYIEYQNDKRPREVFDLRSDPREKHNIIDTDRGKKLEEQLKRELERLKKETGYRFLSRG